MMVKDICNGLRPNRTRSTQISYYTSLKINQILKDCFLAFALCRLGCKRAEKKENNEIESEIVIFDGELNVLNLYAKEQFKKGIMYVHLRDYLKARSCFFNADSASPRNSIILASLGNSVAMTESTNLSFIYFNEAINADSGVARSYINYGYWLNRDKLYDKAVEILNIGIRKAGGSKLDFAVLSLNLSNSLYNLGKDSEAIEVLDSALIGLQPGRVRSVILKAKFGLKGNKQ
jgi:tetratricopeptide (TPR) repeat protein